MEALKLKVAKFKNENIVEAIDEEGRVWFCVSDLAFRSDRTNPGWFVRAHIADVHKMKIVRGQGFDEGLHPGTRHAWYVDGVGARMLIDWLVPYPLYRYATYYKEMKEWVRGEV